MKLPALSRCFQRSARQSITLSVVQVSVPVKFVFSTRPARSNAPSRLTRRIEDCELRVKYWEIIADNLSKAGWSLGWVSALDREGRTICIVDAHRDDGRRFVAVASANRSTACCSDGRAAPFTSFGSVDRTRSCARTTQHAGQAPVSPHRHKAPTAQAPRCSTQRAGIAPPHAEGDGLSGATSDRETFAFISGPAGVVGGVPLTRAMNPWAMPEAST